MVHIILQFAIFDTIFFFSFSKTSFSLDYGTQKQTSTTSNIHGKVYRGFAARSRKAGPKVLFVHTKSISLDVGNWVVFTGMDGQKWLSFLKSNETRDQKMTTPTPVASSSRWNPVCAVSFFFSGMLSVSSYGECRLRAISIHATWPGTHFLLGACESLLFSAFALFFGTIHSLSLFFL